MTHRAEGAEGTARGGTQAAAQARGPGRSRGVADIALAVLVVAIVATMIVPLPLVLLDILLTVNLSLAVVLLLVALYVPDALGIASFPTILLVTTLYRLSLDVASTRLILGRGEAGEVIRAFGQFVVRGNYVVGGVVFIILTIVQFLVIAKGSERVAEVAKLRRGIAALARAFAHASEAEDDRALRSAARSSPLVHWAMRYARAIVLVDRGRKNEALALLANAPAWPEESAFHAFHSELITNAAS